MRCQTLDTPLQVRFSNGAFSGTCDATPEKGGAGQGFRPHELLEAALGSCTSMVLMSYAKNHGIPLAGVEVDVSLDRSEAGVARFLCRIVLRDDLTPQQRERLLRAAKACPVRKTLACEMVFEEAATRA